MTFLQWLPGQRGIQWTGIPGYIGLTWNPTVGCTRVSTGCDNCYAFKLHDDRYAANLKAANEHFADVPVAEGLTSVNKIRAARDGGFDLPFPEQYDRPFSQVQLLDARLDLPNWGGPRSHPRAVFVGSMADLFHEDVPDDYLDRVFAAMAIRPESIFMLLTKRPERMKEYIASRSPHGDPHMIGFYMGQSDPDLPDRFPITWPLPNVWLGTSVENQSEADRRVPILLETPAAKHFISNEPALEAVRFDRLDELDWIIIGGESGPRARQFDVAWARGVIAACREADVAVFYKQGGASNRCLHDGHGGHFECIPSDLRVREFPLAV